jgi:hypothetical protein
MSTGENLKCGAVLLQVSHPFQAGDMTDRVESFSAVVGEKRHEDLP